MIDLEDLARWWWSLTDDEREEMRAGFLQRMEDDPEFAESVRAVVSGPSNPPSNAWGIGDRDGGPLA